MSRHRSYGLRGLGFPSDGGNVEWRDGKPIDKTCPGREPVALSAGNQPIWGYTSSSAFGGRPIFNPAQIACGQKQVDMPGQGKVLKTIVKAAAIGMGSVAAISLGQAALAKGAGVLKGAVAGGGTATGTATSGAGSAAASGAAASGAVAQAAAQTGDLFSRIKESGNKILNFVNQGRTIHAIANGEIPPPPVSIKGNSFLEWAFQVAQDQMIKEHQRKLTRQEEELLRLEIEAMQREMAKQVPERFPKQPSPQIPVQVQVKQAESVQQNKQGDETLKILAMVGIPLIGAILLRG